MALVLRQDPDIDSGIGGDYMAGKGQYQTERHIPR